MVSGRRMNVSAPSDMNGTVNSSTGQVCRLYQSVSFTWPVLFLLILPITAILGNGLVVAAIKKGRHLHRTFYIILASLSVCHILTGALVIPLAIIKAFLGRFPGIAEVCYVWDGLNRICATATIIHLCAICIDGCSSWQRPRLSSAANFSQSSKLIIVIIWFVSSVAAIGPYATYSSAGRKVLASVVKGCQPESHVFIITSSIATFMLPLAVLLLSLGVSIKSACAPGAQSEQYNQSVTSIPVPSVTQSSEFCACPASSSGKAEPTLAMNDVDGEHPGRSTGPDEHEETRSLMVASTLNPGTEDTVVRDALGRTYSLKRKSSTRRSKKGSESPRLERHPSLRFSTRRASAELKRETTKAPGTVKRFSSLRTSRRVRADHESSLLMEPTPLAVQVELFKTDNTSDLNTLGQIDFVQKNTYTPDEHELLLLGPNMPDRNIQVRAETPEVENVVTSVSVDSAKTQLITVVMVAFTFLVLYLPHCAAYVSSAICRTCCATTLSTSTVFALEIIAHCSIAVNPVIYCLCSLQLRQAFWVVVSSQLTGQ